MRADGIWVLILLALPSSSLLLLLLLLFTLCKLLDFSLVVIAVVEAVAKLAVAVGVGVMRIVGEPPPLLLWFEVFVDVVGGCWKNSSSLSAVLDRVSAVSQP